MFSFKEKKAQKGFPSVDFEQKRMIGQGLNFASSEAYKLLRTNLMFSFVDSDAKRVIGITSSVKGEGKSITSINLANAIAETGKRVLLVECDLRLPTMAKRLNLKSEPGLSNLLVGLSSSSEVVRRGVLRATLDVLPAGAVPPNASELLQCSRMQYTIEKFSEYYDYILLDLPPVTVVSDALIVSRLTAGMVVVVRSDYATKAVLGETMRQLKYVNAKVLGFVFNGVKESAGNYYKKYYRKGYGYEYGYGGNEDDGK